MKFKLITCLLLLINLTCYANDSYLQAHLTDTTIHKKIKRNQRKTVYQPIYSREYIKGYKPEFDSCAYTNQFSVAQRLKKYPFSIAAKILAISYVGELPPAPNIDSAGNLLPNQEQISGTDRGITIKKRRLKYNNVKQWTVLNHDQLIKFTDIIFNYSYSGLKDYLTAGIAACFDPRNSIVFLDKNNRVIDHLDICFSCHRSESASGKINIGIECTQKYQMLQNFFIAVGVPYGAD
ncbi:hypothetical protein ACFFGT_20340 [Mucilaginibacter angelicae]|uniref:Uncharacterized protein n=1 Tax=Mucilaginibacter angelicae TaxID=869718 RepID=A0ABV6LAR2_9SPHI